MSPRPEDAVFAVRVTPRSSKNEVRVETDGSLKVWVTTAPVDGEANKAICDFVAKRLKVAKSRVSIVSGDASRVKRISIEGMGREEVISQLGG
jgi:uncharacterized protein (TIGR00251 family)